MTPAALWRKASNHLADLTSPAAFDNVTREVLPDEMERFIPFVTKGEDVLELVAECRS
ncbi:hypothetical protein AGR6A_pAt60096 [Agrobacterium sp. NCPPB 925]|nr:hypothetical protein AGR6A_pAt60096 [Agrobacterium sp. NCPPB 925]